MGEGESEVIYTKDTINNHSTITEEEVVNWCYNMFESEGDRAISYLTEILKGEYDLRTAREDILSFRKIE
jgi:hypothetical protein